MPKKEDWNVEDAEDLGTGQPAANVPAPGVRAKSIYRDTTTPTPESTHGGIEDAGGAKSDAAPEPDFGRDFPSRFDEKFSDALQQSYTILRAVRALPERTRKQATEKARRAGLISAHIRKISNASPVIQFQADEQAVAQKNHGAILERQRLEHLAVHDPLVKKFLTNYDRQAGRIVELLDENAALKNQK
jgi:hypothetical protein